MDILDNLNDKQKEAVMATNGPCLVIAGAGSGKTKVLTHKIAYLIDECGYNPYNILAITFTNKAANEMKERIVNLIGDKSKGLWMGTFHSICVRILRKYIKKLGYESSFLIFDMSDQKTLIKTCMAELNIDSQLFTPKYVQSAISNAKNDMITPEEFKSKAQSEYKKVVIAQIYELYQERLKINNAVDFDDIINLTIKILSENEDVLNEYNEKFKYVLVDEYQDTNKSQFKLIRLLSKNNQITVVGDPEQSIYSFRGADITNILNFEKDFKNTQVIKLEQNYRCSQNILDVANHVIKNNDKSYEKNLWTQNGSGSKPIVFKSENEYGEAEYVAQTISNLVYNGDNYQDIAILYRTNAQSRVIEDMLLRDNIPYKVIGGLKFYERKEIKDCIAFLRLIENPWDNISLRRIINEPKRGIGKTTLDTIENFAKNNNISMYDVVKDADKFGYNKAFLNTRKLVDSYEYLKENKDNLKITQMLENILENSGYLAALKAENSVESDTRIDNIEELLNAISQYEEEDADASLANYLESITLASDVDNLEDSESSVKLLTLHSAKGLEYKNVFLVGMEEGIFPSGRASAIDADMQEERRLFYVGITRAKENLYFTFATRRTTYGKTQHNICSRFLNELPEDIVQGYNIVKTSENFERNPRYLELGDDPRFNKQQREQETEYKFKTATEFLNNLEKIKKEQKIASNIYQTVGVSSLKEGLEVHHAKFGNGVIKALKPEGDDYKVDILFEKVGHKRLMAKYANLRIIKD